MSRPDWIILDHGTLITFDPISERAKAWRHENIDPEELMVYGQDGFHADHRPAREILLALREADHELLFD